MAEHLGDLTALQRLTMPAPSADAGPFSIASRFDPTVRVQVVEQRDIILRWLVPALATDDVVGEARRFVGIVDLVNQRLHEQVVTGRGAAGTIDVAELHARYARQREADQRTIASLRAEVARLKRPGAG